MLIPRQLGRGKREQLNAYLSLPNLRVKATSSLPSTVSIYVTSVQCKAMEPMVSHLPGTTFLERGQEFRLPGFGGSLLLILELFG